MTEAGNSFCYHVQTGSGAHPASYPMGTGGSFLGHPHLVLRLWTCRAVHLLPLMSSWYGA